MASKRKVTFIGDNFLVWIKKTGEQLNVRLLTEYIDGTSHIITQEGRSFKMNQTDYYF